MEVTVIRLLLDKSYRTLTEFETTAKSVHQSLTQQLVMKGFQRQRKSLFQQKRIGREIFNESYNVVMTTNDRRAIGASHCLLLLGLSDLTSLAYPLLKDSASAIVTLTGIEFGVFTRLYDAADNVLNPNVKQVNYELL